MGPESSTFLYMQNTTYKSEYKYNELWAYGMNFYSSFPLNKIEIINTKYYDLLRTN